jgi:hypothetical protein
MRRPGWRKRGWVGWEVVVLRGSAAAVDRPARTRREDRPRRVLRVPSYGSWRRLHCVDCWHSRASLNRRRWQGAGYPLCGGPYLTTTTTTTTCGEERMLGEAEAEAAAAMGGRRGRRGRRGTRGAGPSRGRLGSSRPVAGPWQVESVNAFSVRGSE